MGALPICIHRVLKCGLLDVVVLILFSQAKDFGDFESKCAGIGCPLDLPDKSTR